MPFLLLLILTLTCLQSHWPEPPEELGILGSVLVTWGGVAVLALIAALIAHHYCNALVRAPSNRFELQRQFSRWRSYHQFAQLGFFLAALYELGWGWIGRDLLVQDLWFLPGIELILLLPLLASLLLGWSRFYDVERVAHALTLNSLDEAFVGRRSYVGMQARHHLLLVFPPLLLLMVQQLVLRLFPGLKDNELFMVLFGVGLLAAAFLGIPWILRLVLRLRPLPPGPLRQRLLATATRLNFRCSNLLLWDTRHTMANAMVTGPVPWLRYVVFTDRLIEDLTPEEMDAVFGHEVGHVKHHHMLFYIGFLLTSLVVLGAGWNVLEKQVAQTEALGFLFQVEIFQMLASLPFLALAGAYIFVVFGFLSRRCERQADLYGCRTTSVPVFIDALEKVAVLNGIHREKPGWLSSWQHSTIARRVAFLQRLNADPGLEPRFQRVSLLKWGFSLALAVLLLAFGPREIWEVIRGSETAHPAVRATER